jgi:hypothetical protein
VRAALLALSDPDLKDANILHTIYALAIKHRVDKHPYDEIDAEDDDLAAPAIIRSGKSRAEQRPVH